MANSTSKVQKLALANFTAFEEAHFEFSPGINVFIGTNSTGKTHVMKVIYTFIKTFEEFHQKYPETEFRKILSQIGFMFSRKLHGIFNQEKKSDFEQGETDGFKRKTNLDCIMRLECAKTVFSLDSSGESIDWPGLKDVRPEPPPILAQTIFLPSQEFLSINEGFIAAYEKRELAFDATYYDLALALNASPLRNYSEISDPLKLLREIIAGEDWKKENVVFQKDNRFYFNLPEGKLDVFLVADGYRKLGTLYYLLRNGSLTKDSILFWDEPEANLNPKLIVKVAELLEKFAAAGMQIFIATHDYLLSHELSLLAEYPTEPKVEIKFFAFHKPDRKSGVVVEEGNSLAEIQNNPILAEFSAHYEREAALFNKSGDAEE